MNPAVLSGQTAFSVTFLASLLIWLMFAGIIVLWVIDGRVKKEQALHALLSSLIAWALTQMIKGLFPTDRPFEINNNPVSTLSIPLDGAFPSSHSAVAFALATSLWLHSKKLGTFYFVLAALIGWARVVGNVHFASDIFGGAVIGIITSYLTERLHVFKLVRSKG